MTPYNIRGTKVRKLLQILAVPVICVGFASGIAAADSITTTGAGSTNTISSSSNNNTSVNCENNTNVNSNNLQNAGSGTASANGNTTSGNVGSGNSSNSSSTNVNVNTGCETLGTSGSMGDTAGTTGTTGSGQYTTTPATGLGAASAANPSVSALPDTGSDTVAKVAVGSVTVLTSILALSRFGLGALRRLV